MILRRAGLAAVDAGVVLLFLRLDAPRAAASQPRRRTRHPYGNGFDASKCNGDSTKEPDAIEAVQFRARCESGRGGVYDLAGNVHEWANGCVVGGDPTLDKCALQGSAYTHAESEMVCTAWFGWERSSFDEEVGFRCCSD